MTGELYLYQNKRKKKGKIPSKIVFPADQKVKSKEREISGKFLNEETTKL